ncbi:MAG: hypothetical protein QOF82_358 [Frankiales bacterium]|jgi:uncharacterized protein with FMN-binding domain|nr:hypothetical protein [Frankiales bacterium]MDX6210035.1 hypothetical protein [Frankiales bacterium]MDX6211271.1 hypothetical protein [Frankiales bacterium]
MRRVIATVVGTVVALVLLLSFKTHSVTASALRQSAVSTPGASTPSTVPSTPAAPSASSSASTGGGATAGPTTAAPTTTKAPSSAKKTIDGDAVDTRYGPVQVQVVMSGSQLTAINILQVPNQERRDIEINNYAVPLLNQEALQAQSAQINMISGATYTSQGYLQSLQSALDKS